MKHISARYYIRRGRLWRVKKPAQVSRPWNGLTDDELIDMCWRVVIETARMQRIMEGEK